MHPVSKKDIRKRILLVDEDKAALEFMLQILSNFEVSTAKSMASALGALTQKSFDLMICSNAMDDAPCSDFLRHSKEEWPACKRILWATYGELPKVIGSGVGALADRVLPKPVKAEVARRAIQNTLLGERTDYSTVYNLQASICEVVFKAQELMQKTAEQLTRIPKSVVRQPPEDNALLELQFVLPCSKSFEKVRDKLATDWHMPYKIRGKNLSRSEKRHPVINILGKINKDQELFIRQLSGDNIYAYVLFMPWKDGKRQTALLGVHQQGKHHDVFKAMLDEIQIDALSNLSQFHYAFADTHNKERRNTGEPDYIFEYDWVAAGAYVGPDRRGQPTPFMALRTFFGKRQEVPKALLQFGGRFVDKMDIFTRLFFWLYVVLSLIDTILTHIYVGSGHFQELNPLLKPLVSEHPLTFFLVKNIGSLAT
ncbi:MAG: DUF5658 family protein, partial [Myxococcota bacterium]|nr:DUF5658 family protein [Myxococcota bacterium]